MKKLIVGLLAAGTITAAWASCTTQTVSTPNGMQTCTTCCQGNNCSTTCF